MCESITQYSERKNIDKKLIDSFVENIYYLSIQTENPDDYIKLKEKLNELDYQKNINGKHIFYLSTPPKLYDTIIDGLRKSNLHKNGSIHNEKKIIVEKPFGFNLHSAEKLNKKLHSVFNEKQVYRIDHYLGKETVQNVLVLRFSNGIFEPLWNRNYIDRVEITSAENIGVENRGGYYEGIGALRDMIQNHMLQVAAFIAMEPPSNFDPDSIRNETMKVFQYPNDQIFLSETNTQTQLTFLARGRIFSNNIPPYTFDICHPKHPYGRQIQVTPTGRASIKRCSVTVTGNSCSCN